MAQEGKKRGQGLEVYYRGRYDDVTLTQHNGTPLKRLFSQGAASDSTLPTLRYFTRSPELSELVHFLPVQELRLFDLPTFQV